MTSPKLPVELQTMLSTLADDLDSTVPSIPGFLACQDDDGTREAIVDMAVLFATMADSVRALIRTHGDPNADAEA